MQREVTNFVKGKFKQESQDGPVWLTWLPEKFESIGLLFKRRSSI